jgi:hypothetical protein
MASPVSIVAHEDRPRLTRASLPPDRRPAATADPARRDHGAAALDHGTDRADWLAVGTVRRGIDILVKEGLVQTVPGRGIFVKR